MNGLWIVGLFYVAIVVAVLVWHYAAHRDDDDAEAWQDRILRDLAVHGNAYTLTERDRPLRRVPARDVIPAIESASASWVGTAAMIAWGAYWIGIIWAVATGRLP